MNKPNITSWKTIWSLAWPHAVMNMLFTFLMLVDIYWVGDWGGDDPINAISICGPIIWTFQSASMFIFHGMLSMISRCVGSGDKRNATLISHQGIMVGLFIGGIIALFGVMLSDPILNLYQSTRSIHTMGVIYLKIILGTNPMFFLFMAIYAVFSAHNNTKDPMFMSLTAWALNMILDPLLIYGFGTYTWKNGTIYAGNWEKSIRTGQGTMTFPNGDKYNGQWNNNKRNGTGTMQWKSGKIYKGNWIYDIREGKGTLKDVNGDRYEGDWKANKKNGTGTMVWIDGSKYIGEWKDDYRNGQGVMTGAKGTVEKGKFINDVFVGK